MVPCEKRIVFCIIIIFLYFFIFYSTVILEKENLRCIIGKIYIYFLK